MVLLKSFFIIFLITSVQSVNSKEIEDYRKNLIILGEKDQKVRSEYTYWEDAIRINKENLVQLKELINIHGFPILSKVGEKAHTAAFLIAQHAVSDKLFMEYFLREMKSRLGSTEVIDQYYAYLLDRTNQMSGLKQIYGTQGKCVDAVWEPEPIDNLEELVSLRAEIGLLPMQQFSKQACSSQAHH